MYKIRPLNLEEIAILPPLRFPRRPFPGLDAAAPVLIY